MFFYIVLTPISTTSGLWSTGNTRKYHQIYVYIYMYQCVIGLPAKHHINDVLIIWPATCDFQQCCILTRVNFDEPVQIPSKLRNCQWCSASSTGWSWALLVVKISCHGSIISFYGKILYLWVTFNSPKTVRTWQRTMVPWTDQKSSILLIFTYYHVYTTSQVSIFNFHLAWYFELNQT